MKIYQIAIKQSKNTYDIYAISGGNKVFISKVDAFSEAQALKFIENNHRVIDYKRMGWSIIASLDEKKAKRREENKIQEEKNIQEMWWNKD